MANCKICNDKINRLNKGCNCVICKLSFHQKCENIRSDLFTEIESGNIYWKCSSCNKNTLKHSTDFSESLVAMKADVESIKKTQCDLIKSLEILEVFRKQQEKFEIAIDRFNSKCNDLIRLDNMVHENENKISTLQNENLILKNELKIVTTRCDILEKHSFSSFMVVHGVPKKNNENLGGVLEKICRVIGFNAETNQIKYIYRSNSASEIKPITVEFHSKHVKDMFLIAAKSKSKIIASDIGFENSTSKIFVTDHLTATKKRLLYETKILLKSEQYRYKYVWVKYGEIFCKKDDDSEAIKISSTRDLDKLKMLE